MSYDHTLATPRRLTGYHVLGIFAGFFGLIFVMNGFMIYQAITTFGGLETQDAYRKGLAYNKRIAAEESQARLGWTAALSVGRDKDGLTLRMTGNDGQPVTGLKISGALGRSATNRFDRSVSLIEAEPGIYISAGGDRLEPGTWIATLEATGSGEAARREATFEIRRRVWVSP
ncbi:MAG: FixH family protein [Hyphomicrobium sp.]|jgi:nitrogen fixation protein FixH